MRSAIVIVAGYVLLAVFVLAGRYLGAGAPGMARAALVFLPVWLVIAAVNMGMGVARGYSVAEEAPIFLVIFALPAAAAAFAWWRWSQP